MSLLKVDNVSICYKLGDFKDIGLKEWTMRHLTRNYRVEKFMAVDGVSFELNKGDMLGIIGANGAGKSTLLKAIAGIMEPTEGCITRCGHISALLELASGFDGDLSVKENAYLRGAMLGYTRQFMNETYEQIIAYAELEAYQDRPFKQLSTGMQSRLAFSIASLVKPEILILDEVLSVGDGAFQEKSAKKMRAIIDGGAATILVSHSLAQIQKLCTKVLWLHRGKQIAFGETREICDRYKAFLDGDQAALQVDWQPSCPEPELKIELEQVSKSEKEISDESLTDNDINYAYRFLLRREPESAEVVEYWKKSGLTLEELISLFWGGEEFSRLAFTASTDERIRSAFFHEAEGFYKACPICGQKTAHFETYGEKNRADAMCPSCRSVERHRAYFLYFARETDLLSPKRQFTLLHFAPEPCLSGFFRAAAEIDYYPVDYDPLFPGILDVVDIRDIPYKNDMFDYIICNHVLEHVEQERIALAELRRVLKSRGKAFINVPVDPVLEQTLERDEYSTPELRSKFYGQNDHVRQYGNDFEEKLRNAGFMVSVVFQDAYFTDEEIRKYGLLRTERIYICTKND